jgi:predicted RNase H-like nuclease
MGDNGRMDGSDVWLAGVDGCRAGWLAVFVRAAGDEARIRVIPRFDAILSAAECPAVIAVDMPIGLPERTGYGGRSAENAVRPLLGARQSAVFSVPSRAATAQTDYREACAAALATSEPPRKISKQLFMIAPKIREIDACLRDDAAAAARCFEVHPEVAFWRLNGERPLTEPKKIKGRGHEPGLALRRVLLVAAGLPREIAQGAPPPGAAADDLLDALACAAIARRIHAGIAKPFPDPPPVDRYGLPMAIWA